MRIAKIPMLFLMGLLLFNSLLARGRVEIDFASTPFIDDKLKLHIELDLVNRAYFPIREVRIHYRNFSETQFRSQQLQSEGFRYLGNIDMAEYQGSMVEYFFSVEYADGSQQAYPPEAPEYNLFQASLQQDFGSGESIVVISPEPGEFIYTDEFILTVSFFEYSSRVDPERTKVFLDNYDVSRSQFLQAYEDFLTFAPRRIPPGNHRLRIELYDAAGRFLTQKDWRFTATQRKGPGPSTREFMLRGSFFAENRYEDLISGIRTENYAKSGLRLSGETQSLSFGTWLFLSNQEESTLQPINRYSGWVQWDFWNNRYLRFTGGDAYPEFNRFLMQNVFLRGMHAQLFLKFLNLDFATGRTLRGIEGREVVSVDPQQGDTTRSIIPGTFERDVWAVRASFGGRKHFQLGFTAVKGKDDVNSIRFAENPEESAAGGVDVYLATPDNRIILEGSFNVSTYNPDILDGQDTPLDTLEKLGVDIPQSLYDFATGIITVNENLIVYPAFSYYGQLRLNVLNNHLSVQYKYVESDFRSLGQPFLLRDNKGLTITDNVRLFQNQVFLNLRYQQYQNNLADNKIATTDSRTLGFNLSYFPLRNLPSLTLGFNNYQRDNGISDNSNPLAFPEDNRTNTIIFSSSYAFIFSNLRNRVTLNVLNYNRTDQTTFGLDNLSSTFSLLLQTRYAIPLRSRLEFSFQQNENTAAQTNQSELSLSSFGGGLEYRLGRLFNPRDNLLLAVNGRFGLVNSTVTSLNIGQANDFDYNRSFFNARIIYGFPPYGRISLNGDLISYSGDRDFRDYILMARYDVNF